jgi:hypothetical protein
LLACLLCRCGLWVVKECINPSVVCLLVWLGCCALFCCGCGGLLRSLVCILWLFCCCIAWVLSRLAWVGFFMALVAFVPVLFLVSCSFLLVVFLPVWFCWFRSGSVSCSVAVRFLVVAFLLLFWQFLSAGLCPVVVACVVVWCCVFFLFPFSFLRVEGGEVVGWLFYYQIQKFPVVSFTV